MLTFINCAVVFLTCAESGSSSGWSHVALLQLTGKRMCVFGGGEQGEKGEEAQLPVGMCSTWSAINYTHNRLADGRAGGDG